MKEVKLEEAAYQFEAKMSLRQAIPLGLQHVCAMFVGNLTPLLIITSACGIAGGEFADLQVTLLQSDNVVSAKAQADGRDFAGLGITPSSIEAVVPSYLWRFRKTGQFDTARAN